MENKKSIIFIMLMTIVIICGIYILHNFGNNPEENMTYSNLNMHYNDDSTQEKANDAENIFSDEETTFITESIGFDSTQFINKDISDEEFLQDGHYVPDDRELSDYIDKTDIASLSFKERKKLIDFDADLPYLIKINRSQNFVIIYGINKKGHYSIPYKAFICSTGLNKGDTPLGTFELGESYTWREMVDGSYGQYAIRIYGSILLHSVPYYSPSKDMLETQEYNKLGKPASLGCVRFNVRSIKWIYDNCPRGTAVMIYDSKEETPPLELPSLKKLKLDSHKSGWDPTDHDEDNPWK